MVTHPPAITDVMRSLPGRFWPKMAGNMKATIQFDFTGTNDRLWVLSIASGACVVRPGLDETADATVMMSAADFVGINTGEINATDVFWSGRIQIEGDAEAVIALAPVMGWQ